MANTERVAFVGDLHFYDGPARAHKDYFANCKACLDMYTSEFQESKPDYIFLTGDIVGLSERVMRTRVGLSILIAYLQKWAEICNGNLYSIAGNHDYTKGSHLSDFDLLTQLGIIKTAKFVDINALRVHLIDYGKEQEPIFLDPSKHNIALMHADLQIDGLTTWFHAGADSINLASLKNLKGVEYVLAGHIHNPSPRVVSCSIEDENCCLLYLGNASRPRRKDTWTGVWIVYADCSDTGGVDLGKTKLLNLVSPDEIFVEKLSEDTEGTSEIEDAPVVDLELLTKILDELSPVMMGSHLDYKEQVRRLAGTDQAAAEIAISYLDVADEQAKTV